MLTMISTKCTSTAFFAKNILLLMFGKLIVVVLICLKFDGFLIKILLNIKSLDPSFANFKVLLN